MNTALIVYGIDFFDYSIKWKSCYIHSLVCQLKICLGLFKGYLVGVCGGFFLVS